MHYIPKTKDSFYTNNVLFITHAEKDIRGECFDTLISNNINTKLHSHNWKKVYPKTDINLILPPIYGELYNISIYSAIVTVCFFSKLNQDKLTMRVFEIPACGGLLLCERNDVVTKIFIENEEAYYFTSPKEFFEKILFIKNNNIEINRVRINGIKKANSIGKIDFRLTDFLEQIK